MGHILLVLISIFLISCADQQIGKNTEIEINKPPVVTQHHYHQKKVKRSSLTQNGIPVENLAVLKKEERGV